METINYVHVIVYRPYPSPALSKVNPRCHSFRGWQTKVEHRIGRRNPGRSLWWPIAFDHPQTLHPTSVDIATSAPWRGWFRTWTFPAAPCAHTPANSHLPRLSTSGWCPVPEPYPLPGQDHLRRSWTDVRCRPSSPASPDWSGRRRWIRWPGINVSLPGQFDPGIQSRQGYWDHRIDISLTHMKSEIGRSSSFIILLCCFFQTFIDTLYTWLYSINRNFAED